MMNGNQSDWQTWTALAIVAITVIIFTVRIIRRRRNSKAGCGSDCGCAKPSLTTGQQSSPSKH